MDSGYLLGTKIENDRLIVFNVHFRGNSVMLFTKR